MQIEMATELHGDRLVKKKCLMDRVMLAVQFFSMWRLVP